MGRLFIYPGVSTALAKLGDIAGVSKYRFVSETRLARAGVRYDLGDKAGALEDYQYYLEHYPGGAQDLRHRVRARVIELGGAPAG